MNKVILITNRKIRGDGSRRGQTLLKNKLKKKSDSLRIVEVAPRSTAKHWKHDLVPEGDEASFLQNLASNNGTKRWLIFNHGNNQTAAKNLAKCFKLAELYDVNILGFSWPSVHYGKIRKWLKLIPTTGLTLGYAAKQLRGKIKQYKKAQGVARESTEDFALALKWIKSNFIPHLPSGSKTPNLVCHSMGNYLLERTTKVGLHDMPNLLSVYDHVVLHQADCSNASHQEWIDLLGHENIHITCNKKDRALMLSDYVNHLRGKNSRLGNVVNITTQNSPDYKDWTAAHKKAESSGHALFLTKPSSHRGLHEYFNNIFN